MPGWRKLRQVEPARLTAAGWRVGRRLLDTLVPPVCSRCGMEISGTAGLCGPCWGGLEVICEPVCAVSGVPLAYAGGPAAVGEARTGPKVPWDRARGAVVFTDAAQALVHALKYHDRHDVVDLMAAMMSHAGRGLFQSSPPPLLVPVPLHRHRLWTRRYNQSALLARRIARQTGLECHAHGLRRCRNTPPQVGYDRGQRRRNVRGAFEVDPAAHSTFEGRNVILVDDVLTSGSTASACATALKRGGCARVDVLVFALVC